MPPADMGALSSGQFGTGGTQLLKEWVVYGMVVPAAGALWLLRVLRLITPVPWWVLVGLVVGGLLLTTATDRWYQLRPSGFRLNVRMASQVAVTTTMIYAIGWGPLLAIGYLFSVQESIALAGSRVWRPAVVWSILGIACGQCAIAAGLVSSFVTQPAVQGLAVLVAVCLASVIRLIGKTAEGKERAEAEMRRSEERFRSLVQNASDVIGVLDAELRVSYLSGAITGVTGHPPSRYLGSVGLDFVHPDDASDIARGIEGLLASPGATTSVEARVQHRDGSWRWVEATITNLLHHPSVNGVALNFHDVTERRQLAATLQFGAYHDALTGLPNRRAFLDMLGDALIRGRRQRSTVAVMFCDLDRFKLVNDSLGHGVGDELLVVVADRLATAAGEGHVISRFAGDEFAVLLPDAGDATSVVAVAERLIATFRAPITLGERERKISISIGIAMGDPDDEPGDLLREADLAMYQAKERGRGGWAIFDTLTERRVLESIALEAELWQAVEGGELTVLFQPEVDVATGEIVGAEALVRWNHPRRGLVPPDEFIPLAEESGLILSIDRAVLTTACAALARWRSRGVAPSVRVSVNLSPTWFRDLDRISELIDLVAGSDVTPSDLQLEITERLALGNTPETTDAVARLRAAGFRVAIDDFGAGYSSLAYLSRFQVDALKLDRSFVAAADTSEHGGAILRAMVTVGHALGTQLVAEGVERPAQLDLLRQWGCQRAQGFLFAPALPEREMLALLLGRADPEEIGPVPGHGLAPAGAGVASAGRNRGSG